MTLKRYAIVTGLHATAETVARYLPGNYRVLGTTSHGVVIQGTDAHWWGLDSYVAPRLASGLMRAVEVDLSHPALRQIPVVTTDPAPPADFGTWMEAVDNAVQASCGASVHDLPDCPFADWFGDGLSPREAAGRWPHSATPASSCTRPTSLRSRRINRWSTGPCSRACAKRGNPGTKPSFRATTGGPSR